MTEREAKELVETVITGLTQALEEARAQLKEYEECLAEMSHIAAEAELRAQKVEWPQVVFHAPEEGGRAVRHAWVEWAKTQPNPKPSWLVPYDDLSEPDKEADRQIAQYLAQTFLRDLREKLSAAEAELETLRSRNGMLEDMLEVLGVSEDQWFKGYGKMVEAIESGERKGMERAAEIVNNYGKLHSLSSRFTCEAMAAQIRELTGSNPSPVFTQAEVKEIAVDFFRHWWNKPGSNTEQDSTSGGLTGRKASDQFTN